MYKKLMILLSAMPLMAGIARMETGERTITAAAFLILLVIVRFLYRRFRRLAEEVAWIFQATAAIAVALGLLTMISGVVHSTAVTVVAFSEGQWGPVTILRFTTGAMLIYSGAISVALHRAIRAGQRWAVRVGAATAMLFCSYLMFLLPLPGTGGTVPPMLGLWSAFLLWLGASVLASLPRDAARLRLSQQA